MDAVSALSAVHLPPAVRAAVESSPRVLVPQTRDELYQLALGPVGGPIHEVAYDVSTDEGMRRIVEATVTRCRNGMAVNYPEDYMRRRDPDCMRIADDLPTDKPRYRDVFGEEFAPTKTATLDWLGEQDLVVVPFKAGGPTFGYPSVALVPVNAAFFAVALVDLQGWVTFDELGEFTPRSILYVAPPFRHTAFGGRQVVVHDRTPDLHEVFAYNLYPGPSAKKGVFSVLLDIGESEGWITAHASAVRVTTPYDNETVIMHEGASGGGKSEMCQEFRRQEDGRILLGTNVVTKEPYVITLAESSALAPVTDDMTLCHASLQDTDGRLVIADAEAGWFVRVDNLRSYGEDTNFERACIHPDKPLVFFNIQGVPDATALPWEHTLDSTGKPCPNPRVVIDRSMIRGVLSEPEHVDVRTFGVRMPACTRDKPSYGIMGVTHFVPPALAWVWRLIAPRGDKNPSIGETKSENKVIKHGGMVSEGVGSYWPFSTGTKVAAANLLLRQLVDASRTRYVLTPNQHIGAYQVGFAAEWMTREYLARRGGGRMRRDQLTPARCSLFGYTLREMKVDGQLVRPTWLAPEMQSQVGLEAYDEGAAIINAFFKSELEQYLTDDLDPLGRAIIEVVLKDGSVEDYEALTPMHI
ncbi:MAG: DUF4914 family protein [Cellulomonas sp.]|uniref:DUF4914 domain-containing protein n=1 Tax=Cellulomonas gelida TaxID=1712 RepID=A0A4Y3KGP6_9CELL|nr:MULTISPECIES: DUF4914 family protein [Cellulomonas]MCR6646883.1 DUF4914 family protein [Cellulomonas sp.]MCR6706315.1 DUF4914 family protein [Cellulomonas sp.]GEA83162.1 DUF4914 domain-containing protein [Cellulomonas gelida]GGL29667.1 DUF4914 domain-containing protein [Cellulomonas gelida]